MRCQELMHMHALLLEIRETLEQDNQVPHNAFESYDTQPVRPSHIHRPKDAHKNAIHLLLDGVDQSVQTHPPPQYALPL